MTPESFVTRWSAASASERSNSQLFLSELADLLQVERPHNNFDHGYAFEFTVTEHHHDGSTSDRRIDLYKRACFVLESKQFQTAAPDPTALAQAAVAAAQLQLKKKSAPVRGTDQWDDAMTRARGQAERYIRALPASEPNPPFLIVVDVGDTIELYADFTQAGKAYLPFPDPRRFRIRLADLKDEAIRERLRLVWTDPLSLDPARKSAEVTRDIAAYLAELAKSYESAGHPPQTVADFLSRCLFCMFAEDVGLLPKDSFKNLLEQVNDDGSGFQELLGQLFREMNTGTGDKLSLVLRKKLLQFNGGLFADDTVLPVNKHQLILLRAASGLNWRNVEPAIFGTLLERALNPHDRHKLGAHYTPRAYVERLVLPTVIEPLRAEWESVRTAALTHARLGKVDKAIKEIRDWHQKLCQVKVLDPACGSGNFLYVTLEHMKRLEGEVLLELEKYGDRELTFEMQHFSVDPHQFLGIEVNPRAASITELVLWIGYLQWHFRTRGQTMPAEPIIKKFKNIECRDAVLAWDGQPEPAYDEHGKPLTHWDGITTRTHSVSGEQVPDENARIPVFKYNNPRRSLWPEADYIVGNPPFLGNKRMRLALGDGYVEALREVDADVPGSADYVMYWWNRAAELLRAGRIRQFGLITTNSITQTYSGQLVERHLTATPPISLAFAIRDHPWVDTAEGAAVRISMTVARAGASSGKAYLIKSEKILADGSISIELEEKVGRINSRLEVSTTSHTVAPLNGNKFLCWQGCKLVGDGFQVSPQTFAKLTEADASSRKHLRSYWAGNDLTKTRRPRYVIDLFGLSLEQVRKQHPHLLQHVSTYVLPEREQNRDKTFREKWWIFGRPRPDLRAACANLSRYIVTSEVAKHRVFTFLEWPSELIDGSVIAIASDDSYVLGVLSSALHVRWTLERGGVLEDRPRYQNGPCFDPFPFPDCTEPQRERIRKIAEELDAHRKRVQAQHEGLTLTGMYNVLEKLRANQPLNPKEKDIHDKALVSVLKQLHDDLDAAVFEAYGWPKNLTDAEILERLVALNAERAREEAAGHIRWLRPDYQIPLFSKSPTPNRNPNLNLPIPDDTDSTKNSPSSRTTVGTRSTRVPLRPSRDTTSTTTPRTRAKTATTAPNSKLTTKNSKLAKLPWPKSLPDRAKAIESLLHSSTTPVTPAEIARHFRKPRYDHLPEIEEILETLCTFGRAHPGKQKGTYSK